MRLQSAFIFLRWVLYRGVVFTCVLLCLAFFIHMVEKQWIDREEEAEIAEYAAEQV